MFMIRSRITFPLSNLPLKNLSQLHFSGKWCLIMLDLSFCPMGSKAFWFFLICYLFVLAVKLGVLFHLSYLFSLMLYDIETFWLIEKTNWRKLPRSSHISFDYWIGLYYMQGWWIHCHDVVIRIIQGKPLLFKVKDCGSFDKSDPEQQHYPWMTFCSGCLDTSDLT